MNYGQKKNKQRFFIIYSFPIHELFVEIKFSGLLKNEINKYSTIAYFLDKKIVSCFFVVFL